MLDKVALVEQRYEELNRLMADPAVATDPDQVRRHAQEQAEIAGLVHKYRDYRQVQRELASARSLLDDGAEDEDLLALAREEVARLEVREHELYDELRALLVPTDPNDRKDVIVEIRAGTGGEEAALFAANLFRMYSRYAERQGWDVDVLSVNETGIGGFKEIIFEVKGRGAYSRLKWESGVHRVQRVPVTEASGRIHTSTATVAVLPEMDEVEVQIDPKDLRMDIYHASGHGGQNVQKVATAVRITHLPSGIVVACQDERSQLQNRLRAMSILRAKLYEIEHTRLWEAQDESRRQQVGTGERAEKIRTYNFPQNRVTDHRIDVSLYRLQDILDGDLDPFINELATQDQARRLAAAGLNA
jgi:peptide chain release factor 1